VEKDFHVKDIIRDPGAKPGQGQRVSLALPAGWFKPRQNIVYISAELSRLYPIGLTLNMSTA
jgi:hypothetical protein